MGNFLRSSQPIAAEQRLAQISASSKIVRKPSELKLTARAIDTFDFDSHSIDSADGQRSPDQGGETDFEDATEHSRDCDAGRPLLDEETTSMRTSPELPSTTTSSIRSFDAGDDEERPASGDSSRQSPTRPSDAMTGPYASIRFAPRVRIASGLRVPTVARPSAATSRAPSQLSALSRSFDTVETCSSSLSASLRSSVSPGRTWLFGGGTGGFRRTPMSSTSTILNGTAADDGDYFSRPRRSRRRGLAMTPVEDPGESDALLSAREQRAPPGPVGILCNVDRSRLPQQAYGSIAAVPPSEDDGWLPALSGFERQCRSVWHGITAFWCNADDDDDDQRYRY